MKKLMLLNLILCFPLLLMAFSAPPLGNGPVRGNWLSPMPDWRPLWGNEVFIYLNEDEELEANAIVKTTSNNVSLFDEVYLTWAFGNYSGIFGPITQSDLVEIDNEIYEATYTMTIDFQEECNQYTNGIFPIAVELSLKTLIPGAGAFEGPGSLMDYPFADNVDLFNPEFYDELFATFATEKNLLCDGFNPPEGMVVNNTIAQSENSDSGLSTTTSSQEPGEEQTIGIFSVYPNPFIDNFTLKYYLETSSDVQIRIFDLAGKQVIHQKHPAQTMGLQEVIFNFDSQIPPGVYVAHIYFLDKVKSIKLVRLEPLR